MMCATCYCSAIKYSEGVILPGRCEMSPYQTISKLVLNISSSKTILKFGTRVIRVVNWLASIFWKKIEHWSSNLISVPGCVHLQIRMLRLLKFDLNSRNQYKFATPTSLVLRVICKRGPKSEVSMNAALVWRAHWNWERSRRTNHKNASPVLAALYRIPTYVSQCSAWLLLQCW